MEHGAVLHESLKITSTRKFRDESGLLAMSVNTMARLAAGIEI